MAMFGSSYRQEQDLSFLHAEALEARALSVEVCAQLGMSTGPHGLGMPYGDPDGDTAYTKYRSSIAPGKKGAIKAVPEGVPHKWFFNQRALRGADETKTIVITTGEFDAAACMQVRVRAMSLPDGDSSVKLIKTYADEIAAFGRIILAFDGDKSGQKALAEAKGYLPPWKTDAVEWPEGVKDANDMLIAHGEEALRDLLLNSKPANAASFERFSEIEIPPPMPSYPCGVLPMNKHLRWTFPELCVICGPYGSGKSLLAKQLIASALETYDEDVLGNAAVTVFEEDYARHLKSDFVKMHGGERYLNRLFKLHPPRGEPRTVSWWMERMLEMKKRYGVRVFGLDPWNRLDHILMKGETETQYADEVLTTLADFIHDEQLIVIIVAHTAKNIYVNGKVRDFGLADIHGTIHFANRADRGLCVWRGNEYGRDNMFIKFDKIKHEGDMGVKGKQAYTVDPLTKTLRFDGSATAAVNGDEAAVLVGGELGEGY